MVNKITGQDYIDEGYKKFDSEVNQVLKHTRILYQKRVRDAIGTRYFIDVWDYGQHGFQTEVAFYNHEGDCEMDVTLMFKGSIIHNEIYIDYLWHSLHLGYYEQGGDNE